MGMDSPKSKIIIKNYVKNPLFNREEYKIIIYKEKKTNYDKNHIKHLLKEYFKAESENFVIKNLKQKFGGIIINIVVHFYKSCYYLTKFDNRDNLRRKNKISITISSNRRVLKEKKNTL